uniref:Uncharacterized protein n=1 Tax=Phlebotomus papatasi TaxID=29031 RepID=A0A1B0GQK6_PHLPP
MINSLWKSAKEAEEVIKIPLNHTMQEIYRKKHYSDLSYLLIDFFVWHSRKSQDHGKILNTHARHSGGKVIALDNGLDRVFSQLWCGRFCFRH